MDLTPFRNLLKKKCGLFFDNERAATLKMAIEARIKETNIENHTKYFNHLIDDQNEFNHLVNLLTTNETYFFREPVHFTIFSERLIPELIKKKRPGTKIKILSVGCSTGEEPFSVAIALLEKYGEGLKNIFSIIGIDIDKDVVCLAKNGIFGKKSFRGFNNRLLQKYFKKLLNGQYELFSFVKETVEFHNLNLVGNFFPETFQGIDIIFYRNVSIYFRPETQKEIFRKMSQLLNDRGYLFVSSTETLFHNLGILNLIEIDGSFLYQKDINLKVEDRRNPPYMIEDRRLRNADIKCQIENHKVQTRSQKTVKRRRNAEKRGQRTEIRNPKIPIQNGVLWKEKKGKSELFDKALSLAKNKKYKEALNDLDRLFDEDSSFVKAYALKASILINLQELDEAEKICLKILEIDQWLLETHLLLGLIARFKDNEEETIKRFKDALYLKPSCWIAHFYLAEIYHLRGELELAVREYGIVIRLLEKGNIKEHGLTFFPLSFPAEQLSHLCRQNINELKKHLI